MGHIHMDEDKVTYDTSTLYWNLSIILFRDAVYSFLCTVET